MDRANQVYPAEQGKAPSNSTPTRPERRGVSRKTVIDAAKEAVPTMDLADLLCGPGKMRRVGDRWVARCPLPGHEDKTPSFTVYTETNSWFCFGACLRGGDVVDLAAAAWGYGDAEAVMAAADLLHEFGHELPQRPEAWYRKQKRQKPIRNAIEQAKVQHTQRRLFRIFLPLIEEISDEDERREETEHLWDAAERIAALAVAGRAS
jgi:CHC2 zinc finger